MPVKRRKPKRRGRIGLAEGFWELLYGPDRTFATPAEMREAWEASRDEIMASAFGGVGRGSRPFAWWEFEFKGEWPDDVPFARQAEVIHRQKLGDAAELTFIENEWRWAIGSVVQKDLANPKAARQTAIDLMNVPPFYFDEHVAEITAEIQQIGLQKFFERVG